MLVRRGGRRLGAAVALGALCTALLPVLSAPAGAATTVQCPRDNLQTAINAAPSGSTINVSGKCTGNFTITKDLSVVGPATLDGAGSGAVVTIPLLVNATATFRVRMSQLVIQHGGSVGIKNENGLLTLDSSVVRANGSSGISNICVLTVRSSTVSGNQGGGIASSYTYRVESSTISDNADVGIGTAGNDSCNAPPQSGPTQLVRSSRITGNGQGGIAVFGDLEVHDSTIRKNRDSGISVIGSGPVLVASSDVSDNTASFFDGGGIWASGGNFGEFPHITVRNSTINRNSSPHNGGGIEFDSGVLLVAASDVNNNSAANDGGGISNGGGNITLTNSNVRSNTAGHTGGGIANANTFGPFSITAKNTVVHGNTPNNCTPPGSVPGCVG